MASTYRPWIQAPILGHRGSPCTGSHGGTVLAHHTQSKSCLLMEAPLVFCSSWWFQGGAALPRSPALLKPWFWQKCIYLTTLDQPLYPWWTQVAMSFWFPPFLLFHSSSGLVEVGLYQPKGSLPCNSHLKLQPQTRFQHGGTSCSLDRRIGVNCSKTILLAIWAPVFSSGGSHHQRCSLEHWVTACAGVPNTNLSHQSHW